MEDFTGTLYARQTEVKEMLSLLAEAPDGCLCSRGGIPRVTEILQKELVTVKDLEELLSSCIMYSLTDPFTTGLISGLTNYLRCGVWDYYKWEGR